MVQVVINAFPGSQVTQANAASEVTAAFGPNGLPKSSSFAIGLIIPANFDNGLRAGNHLQVNLYINRDDVNRQTATLVQAVIANYAHTLANPPSNTNAGASLGEFYISLSLLISFVVGTSLMPGLVLEEKEKKTLRILMVTSTSFGDMIVGKLLVVLIYQLILTGIVLAIQGGFSGQIPLVLLFALLGAFFSIALGLLFGSIFQTASVARGVGGLASFIYILPGIFIGPLEHLLGSNPVVQALRIVPTYYIANGVYNAIHNQGTGGNTFLDIGVIIGCTSVLLATSTWMLRRQASVAAAI